MEVELRGIVIKGSAAKSPWDIWTAGPCENDAGRTRLPQDGRTPYMVQSLGQAVLQKRSINTSHSEADSCSAATPFSYVRKQ